MQLQSIILSAIVTTVCLHIYAANNPPTLRVRALIDGRSQLVIRPDSVRWEHFDYERPGRLFDENEPTYLNSYVWYPQWPDTDDRHPGPSLPLPVGASFSTNAVTMQVVSARWSVQILQQPDPTNGHTLIVEFDDDPFGADDWYEIVLSGVSVIVAPQLSIEVACVALKWTSESNRLYQVQFATNLPAAAWIDLGAPILGTGTNNLVIDSALGGPRRFYRVLPIP